MLFRNFFDLDPIYQDNLQKYRFLFGKSLMILLIPSKNNMYLPYAITGINDLYRNNKLKIKNEYF